MKLVTINGRPNHKIWRPKHRVQNNVYWKSNDDNFNLKHKTGRNKVKINVGKVGKNQYHVLAKFIREGSCIYDEELYETFPIKEKER